VTAVSSGAVTMQFSWKMDCPQDVCLMAQSFQAVRGGQVAASIDAGEVPETSQQLVSYTITVPAGSGRESQPRGTHVLRPQ
jgi:hypothetical protein